MNQDTGALIAVKKLDLERDDNPKRQLKWMRSLQLEIMMMASFDHENIVRYFGTQQDGRTLYILMEHMPGGSIEGMLTRFGAFPEKMARGYTRQILLGLEYLHGHKIAHRDIKGANVLLSNDGQIKLADFGSSKKIESLFKRSGDLSEVTKSLRGVPPGTPPGVESGQRGLKASDSIKGSIKGTPHYMAPEMLTGGEVSTECDIWSVGCVVVEMVTGKPPYAEAGFENMFAVMLHIAKQGTRPSDPSKISQECKGFLSRCFQRDPGMRPGARELVNDPWISVDVIVDL